MVEIKIWEKGMKETGIIMSGNHPRLIIEGRKTQTRRTYGLETVNRNPNEYKLINFDGQTADFARGNHNIAGVNVAVVYHCKCPYGQVGDRLWVRETFIKKKERYADVIGAFAYKADYDQTFAGAKWKPSIHIPRWASRITLEITGLRAERVQEITAGDCTKEGIPYEDGDYVTMKAFDKFHLLWDSLNAKRGYDWETNPWVWVISFKKL